MRLVMLARWKPYTPYKRNQLFAGWLEVGA
jgi:hypothetical protein